jgi:hypothetical protein
MLPTMNAEASLYGRAAHVFAAEGTADGEPRAGAVTPQLCINSPCLRLPSGRFCFNLPFFGTRCVNIPNLGGWRLRCCTRWGWPPVSCGLQRC